MTQQPDIHLQSFTLIFNKKDKPSIKSTQSRFEDSSFIFISPCDRIEISGNSRGSLQKESITAKIGTEERLILSTGDGRVSGNVAPDYSDLECCACSAQIDINFKTQGFTIYSSVVGLPPVFLHETDDRLIITSDIYLLTDIPQLSLYFDTQSVKEIATIGYPIDNKTLFKNVKMLPAGHILSVNKYKDIKITRQSSFPKYRTQPSMFEFIELQAVAFKNALRRINLSKSFLSLTAGMDTRAILAVLATDNITLPACTMSGSTLSLDARTARKLSKAYKNDHNIIYIDNEFLTELPYLSCEACWLSGGLSSLTQAHEVYFYSKVDKSYSARISGNLGNQVGRGGAENISLRNAGFSTFHEDFFDQDNGSDLNHWYTPYIRDGGHLSFQFLMEQEIPFSSVGNYNVGNFYTSQQSPYADKQLIEISNNRPILPVKDKETSLLAMRIKDLRHRFLCEPITTSFQRKLIKESGGAVANIPINWGGKAKGGVSIGGVALGMRALADAALSSKSIDSGLIYNMASLFNIVGLHEYRPYNRWLKGPMVEFTLDLISSTSTEECGLFDKSRLQECTHQYFDNQSDTYKNMLLTLDLALAAKVFNARVE